MPTSRTSAIVRVTMTLALCAGLAGCASEGGSDDGSFLDTINPLNWVGLNEKVEKPQPIVVPYDDMNKMGYQLAWTSFAAVQTGKSLEAVDLLDGMVLARDTHGAFTALSPVSGDTKWAQLVSATLTRYVGAAKQGKVLHVMSEGDLVMLNADTGEALLDRNDLPIRQKFSRVVSTHPIQVGPLYVFGCTSGHAFSHLSTVGVSPWSYLIGGELRCDPAALNSGHVVFASNQGHVLVMNATNGASAGRIRLYGPIVATPAVGPDRFFVACTDQSLYALDDTNAAMIWRVKTESPLTTSPAYDNGKVYFDSPGTGVVAVHASNGARAWVASNASGQIIARRRNNLIAWNGSELTLLDSTDGSVIHRLSLPGVLNVQAERFDNGAIYISWPNGQISRFAAN